jgi:xylulokinase
MNNGPMILGIDLGSTVFKADLFDPALRSVGRGSAPVAYGPACGNRVEMPVAENEAALREAIAGALRSAGCQASDLRAVAFASQAQTFTVRAPDGRAKLPFISWRDTRCEGHNVAAQSLADFAAHCSVADCVPGLTVAKLAFLREQASRPPVAPEDLLLWLPTWFVMELTGRAVVDANLAAMGGLYSLSLGGWWPEALELCGLRSGNLPGLVPLGSVAGTTTRSAAKYGLSAGVPVVLAGNDQTAGAYGAAIHETDAVLVSLGTAQVVYASLPAMPAAVSGLMRGPYPGGRFYQLGADSFGAGTVNWARAVLPGCASEKEFDTAAASAPPDCHGVRFVADGPAGTGRWTGLAHPAATAADQARAVLVTLTDRLGALLARLSVDVRRHPVLLSGGGSESAPWRDCLRGQLKLDFTRVQAASPPLGAAQMARDCLAAHTGNPSLQET